MFDIWKISSSRNLWLHHDLATWMFSNSALQFVSDSGLSQGMFGYDSRVDRIDIRQSEATTVEETLFYQKTITLIDLNQEASCWF